MMAVVYHGTKAAANAAHLANVAGLGVGEQAYLIERRGTDGNRVYHTMLESDTADVLPGEKILKAEGGS